MKQVLMKYCYIDLFIVADDFVMEMRPCRHPGHADIADDLSLRDARPIMYSGGEPTEVAVSGVEVRIVADFHVVAVAVIAPGLDDDAASRGENRRALGSREVDAAVHPRIT